MLALFPQMVGIRLQRHHHDVLRREIAAQAIVEMERPRFRLVFEERDLPQRREQLDLALEQEGVIATDDLQDGVGGDAPALTAVALSVRAAPQAHEQAAQDFDRKRLAFPGFPLFPAESLLDEVLEISYSLRGNFPCCARRSTRRSSRRSGP